MKFSSMFVVCFLFLSLQNVWAEGTGETKTFQDPPEPASSSSSPKTDISFQGIGDSASKFFTKVSESVKSIKFADGKGLDEVVTAVKGLCDKLSSHQSNFSPAGPIGAKIKAVQHSCTTYPNAQKLCVSSQKLGSDACLQESSIGLNEATLAMQGLMAVGSAVITDSCGKAAQMVDIAKKGVAVYTVACNAQRIVCSTACGRVAEHITAIKAATGGKDNGTVAVAPCTKADIPTVGSTGNEIEDMNKCDDARVALENDLNQISVQLSLELVDTDRSSVSGKKKTCAVDFAGFTASAVATAGSLVQSYLQAQKCEKETAAKAAMAPLNCDDPANNSVPECICKRAPRSQGCANSLVKAGGPEAATASGSTAPTLLGTRSGLPPEGTTVGRDPAGVAEKSTAASNAGGAHAGAPVGGSGSGGGIGGTDGSGAGGQEMPGGHRGRGYNTNVMGGYDGGGGSGGGRGGFRSDADANKALANYRKGIDPVKVAAQAWSREVSPQSGRSNFEKIKSRYNDNRRTLVGQ